MCRPAVNCWRACARRFLTNPRRTKAMNQRETTEWCDIMVCGANRADLPRVLLVGDSITRGYFPHVEKALSGTFLCARLATSACVCEPVFHEWLAMVLARDQFAVIHFNNGLHGWSFDEAAYGAALSKTYDELARHAPGSRLLWAQSTPWRCKGNLTEFDERNDRVCARNRIAAELARARGIPVNDLYGIVCEHPDYWCDDGIHFNDAGSAALAASVAKHIQ